VWIGALGPGVAAGRKLQGCAGSNQVAATALSVLGIDWRAFDPAAGAPLAILQGAKP